MDVTKILHCSCVDGMKVVIEKMGTNVSNTVMVQLLDRTGKPLSCK